jgi:hypothetical protein
MLEDVQEYEESGRRLKINGYFYNFTNESKTKNKYYQCYKRSGIIKCRGSVTISPNRQIIKRVEHTCQNQILEEVQVYEETGRRFKINGYCYNFKQEYTKKNKYYTCNKKSSAFKCRGSVTVSPNRQIIKKVEHTCQFQEENLLDINAEILPGNVTLSEEIIKNDETVIEFNKNYRVKKETSNELPTELQERLEQNQERHSLPEIKVLFWFGYFAFTFN